MRKYLLGIGVAAVVALAAGCSGSDTSGGSGSDLSGMDQSQTSTAADSAGQAEHNDQDIAFAQGMIPHHQQAVDMAKMAAEKATNPKVKDLAGRIEGAQDPEIQQLTGMLDAWNASMPGMSGMPTTSGMPGMDMSGDGMMTDEEMGQLEQASGADFDRMWVQMMIKHHQGAVTMAKTELEQGSNAGAKALAQKIVDAQKSEITEMQGLSL
ncbi:DUF305 domain-containing protein [Actinophytocola sp.]|uniref:DUF305 domain-containing protein n=1 Tax=Actinophytocola sp. TaxID=1872138 RepID=UPI00389B2DB4